MCSYGLRFLQFEFSTPGITQFLTADQADNAIASGGDSFAGEHPAHHPLHPQAPEGDVVLRCGADVYLGRL